MLSWCRNARLLSESGRCARSLSSATSTNGGPGRINPSNSAPPAAPRGMHDSLGADAEKREYITQVFRSTARSFGFKPIETPVVEETRLFARSLGEASDVVSKEMYSVKGGGTLSEEAVSTNTPAISSEDLTLRPEGTAGTMRALLNSGLIRVPKGGAAAGSGGGTLLQPAQKLYYSGPMFRHERPQKGRFRQFTQLGIESVGGNGEYQSDAEVLSLANTFLKHIFAPPPPPPPPPPPSSSSPLLPAEAEPSPLPFKLLINTLGDAASMQAYSAALKDFFLASKDKLSPVSATRLERGAVLRILDSKDEGDKKVVASGAPCIDDHLTAEAKERFLAVTEALQNLGISYERDYTLVRGLDYYRHTIFEFVYCGSGGSHLGTILAGGRYDGLAPIIGGGGGAVGTSSDVPAIGWAAGLERLCLLTRPDLHETAAARKRPLTVVILPVVPKAGKGASQAAIDALAKRKGMNTAADAASGTKAVEAAIVSSTFTLASFLRERENDEAAYILAEKTNDVKKAVQAASKAKADLAVLIGEDEFASGTAVVKDLQTGEQKTAISSAAAASSAGSASGLNEGVRRLIAEMRKVAAE